MKKGTVKRISMLLSLLMTLWLAGCGYNHGTMQIVSRSARALAAVQSLSFEGTAEGIGTLSGEPLRLSAKGAGDWIAEPLGLRLEGNFALGELLTLRAPLRLLGEEDGLGLYLGVTPAEEPLWIHVPLEQKALTAELDPASLLGLLSDSGALVSRDPTREDGETICLSAVIPGSLLAEDMDGELTATVWLDQKTYLPTRLEADLTELARAALSDSEWPLMQSLTPVSLTMELTVTGVDTAAPVEAPATDRVIYEKTPGGLTEAFTAAGEVRAA